MTIALESMAVVMPEVEGHPNRAGFRGVLTVVDAPSQRAPSGSKGRRVVLTRAAAEAALPSLLGMALDYAPSFDRHDVRRKVGVITSADVVGRNLEIGGFLYAKDFPEVVEEIGKSGRRVGSAAMLSQGRAMQAVADPARRERWTDRANLRTAMAAAVDRLRGLTTSMLENSSRRLETQSATGIEAATSSGPLGMSYEVADVSLIDARARLWILTKVTFTGAAILRKDKAAYQETWIELSG